MAKTKYVRVKVDTPKGTRDLVYRQISKKEIDDSGTNFICEKFCPIGLERCLTLRHPKEFNNPELCFMDFCTSLSEGDEDFSTCVPVEETINDVLVDLDNYFETYITKNGFIRVKTLIDKACNGSCSMYTPDHSKCNPTNALCLLQDVLKASGYEGGRKEESNDGEFN